LERNPKKSEAITLIEKIDLRSVLLQAPWIRIVVASNIFIK
jgi:hypothetical protein